jgi:spore maturation protein CgeB
MMENNLDRDISVDQKMLAEEMQAKHNQLIALIEKKHAEALNGVIRNYEQQLKEKRKILEKSQKESEALYQDVIYREINELKNSWTWKIGFAQTSAIRLIINFFLNPIKFLNSQQYRWHNIYFYNAPQQLIPKIEHKTTEVIPSKVQHAEEYKVEINPSLNTFVCVLDTFTKSCFAPEFNIISPSPENWKKVLEKQKIDGVFVESAWHGNDNTWEGLTSNYAGVKNLESMTNFLHTAKSLGIPSFFWNKEDPVHYTRFIETARLFDYVFTSDAEIIPKYQEQLGHKNIFALPFAAQHKIHNPIRENSRNKTVSFAGSYYNFSFAERKIDMDILLKPAMAFGLDIYDRNYGATGVAAEQYGFPDIYKPAVKGKLEYADMLNAYKDYKVYLNVNSVKYSSTMFARRVFELLACGTPVISNYSKGIVNLLGEDTVFIAESETDTKKYLEQLLGDDLFWWKKSLHGMRKVIEKHTYEDLTTEVFTKMGLPLVNKPDVSFLVVSILTSFEDARYLSEIIKSQEYKPSGILFIPGHGCEFSEDQQAEIQSLNPGFQTVVANSKDENIIRTALSRFKNTHIAFFNPSHYYGKNYLRDFALAVKYSDAKVMGKKDSVSMDRAGRIVLPGLNADFRWVESVPTDSLVIEKSLLQTGDLIRLFGDKMYSKSTADIFSLDPFNFLPNGRENFINAPKRVSETIGI